MSVDDDPVQVQIGFRTRPLRDGGGKPSPGRCPPHRREKSPLAGLAHHLKDLVTPMIPVIQQSLERGDKQHPIPPSVLHDVRDRIADLTGIDRQGIHEVHPGQPFFLTYIGKLAQYVKDPDAGFPEQLKEGVPLGVTSPTLRSPDIWPTKAELRGEESELSDLPELSGRDNYPSAQDFTQEIIATFEEEKLLDMVTGPHTQTEVAQLCGCQPSELCPGPMAAIDEGDKVRTIYDGSWGGGQLPHTRKHSRTYHGPHSAGLCPGHAMAHSHQPWVSTCLGR